MTEGFAAPRLRKARAQGFQVAFAVSLYGVSFGALSVALGFTLWQTMVLSLVMFSGASQFAFIGVVATGGAGFYSCRYRHLGVTGGEEFSVCADHVPYHRERFFSPGTSRSLHGG